MIPLGPDEAAGSTEIRTDATGNSLFFCLHSSHMTEQPDTKTWEHEKGKCFQRLMQCVRKISKTCVLQDHSRKKALF